MEVSQRLHTIARLRPCRLLLLRPHHNSLRHAARRTFQTTPTNSASTSDPPSPPKVITLEKPDKFRPPSHPARLNRRPPRAYNQSQTQYERETSRTKSYPHMFPNQGTFMHWFLTNRRIHLYITLSTLSLLAFISLTQTFAKTSPFAHLIPPINEAFWNPFRYIKEYLAVVRMHIDYRTETVAAERERNILDAQYRRLYRRAHGMENLEREEDQGIDVMGLVPWDDGLTNPERRRGGRTGRITGQMVLDGTAVLGKDGEVRQRAEPGSGGLQPTAEEQQPVEEEHQPVKRKRKLYFGIW